MPINAASEAAALQESRAPKGDSLIWLRRGFFVFFLVSGFCAILYEVIWLRLAMAQFGVTTAVVSIVLSVFMAGLGIGSWGAGRLAKSLRQHGVSGALRAYAIAELLTGLGSFIVPYELTWGRSVLETAKLSSSFGYYLTGGLWIAATLIPWCTLMGSTFPLAMWGLRDGKDGGRSFSYLYLANVCGAVGGALLPLLLIEELGFRSTLQVGGVLNLLLAVSAIMLSWREYPSQAGSTSSSITRPVSAIPQDKGLNLALLFTTGMAGMGLEVVWNRLYTPFVGTQVYAFATVLAIYLGSTFVGSFLYRKGASQTKNYIPIIWPLLGAATLLPLATADPHLRGLSAPLYRVLIGLVPFTALLGFLTPMLVDRYSEGDPDEAGFAYATNIVGCILGPLIAGFLLLPTVGERWSMVIMAGIFFVTAIWFAARERERSSNWLVLGASVALGVAVLALAQDFASIFQRKMIRRDSTATVIAAGDGMDKRLLVNGVGMTMFTPITKTMAHFPLALLSHPPDRALDICFGMGTTYRSLLAWGIHADAAELVPSVPAVFPYFHADAPELMASPMGHIIVDDGRRYLEQTNQTYDVITIDPPPPVQAAGSSLLYSKEFYAIAKRRLRPGGILAQWLPVGSPEVIAAVTRSIQESFTYVRIFTSLDGWGFHYMASDSPIPVLTAEQLAQRVPEKAAADFLEWGPGRTVSEQFARVLGKELSPEDLRKGAPSQGPLTDDRAVNEYYLLRMYKH